jgi:predicted enzyme related to lactoylglutathione lyase
MEHVLGVGGIFFKAKDPGKLATWYRKHLGFELSFEGGAVFRTERKGDQTVWGLFTRDSTYFAPSKAPFMINYRVANLERMLTQLRRSKVKVDQRIEESDFGRFGWASDPEGNRFELWEPPPARRARKSAKR